MHEKHMIQYDLIFIFIVQDFKCKFMLTKQKMLQVKIVHIETLPTNKMHIENNHFKNKLPICIIVRFTKSLFNTQF